MNKIELKPKSREEQLAALRRRAFMASAAKPDFSVFKPKPKPLPKPITAVPEDILITIRVRMYALGALVWITLTASST